MIWGPGSVTDAELNATTQGGTIELLGCNEHDNAGQSKMTPKQALNRWPKSEAAGLRLGAPAVAANAELGGGWLDRFMKGAAIRHLRVAFIPRHWHGSASARTPRTSCAAICKPSGTATTGRSG
ncbi:glycosyl hydrolase [Streptomyces fagopyri]|uniref:Asl1-like glycosyl hydrolase catalytic domain-containing protein n=1 Tax=Streptomyces fagopyri TaxID=2662397 RepID=A0A5Q0L4Q3_9ACTN|nr:glycosyl hydrolase [Streptomyces fagopyri]QFZ71901.1 hypothetical protein GFH48_00190 [Streptomyces fagopyri]